MTEGWTGEGRTRVAGAAGTVTLVEGMTFCISEQCGDIRPGQEQGLFFRDTRLLSRFELTIDGQRLDPLATHSPAPYAATFIARQSPGPGVADSTLLVVRRRYVGNGMREDITVRNLATGPARFALALGVAARCDACIGFHVQTLVKLKVSKAELEEMLGMAIYMGGGPSLMYAANALAAFEEFSAGA